MRYHLLKVVKYLNVKLNYLCYLKIIEVQH